MKKIRKKYLSLILFWLIFYVANAQKSRNVLGYNIIPHIGSSLGNMEISYERVNYKSASSIIPIVILGFNPGSKVNNNSYNATYNIETMYAKIGIEANISNYEYMDKNRTFLQILLGYSINKQISNVTIKGNYFDDLKSQTSHNYNGSLLQFFLLNESILTDQMSISYGIGFGMAYITQENNVNSFLPISCIGGHGFLTRIRSAADLYINIPFKFSIHHQF